MTKHLLVLVGVAAIMGGAWFFSRTGRGSPDPLLPDPSLDLLEPAEDGADPGPGRVPFAADRAAAAAEKNVPFNGQRALGYLEDICAIGPRMSATAGMQRQQELLRKHFQDLGGKVQMQTFMARQVSRPTPVEMANLIVSWQPQRPRRVILCSHYDTRPIADQEPDPRRWRDRFVSANDGGSGVAFLMELAHHVKEIPTAVGIDFVFFDGEEYIFDRQADEYFFGSKHFAQAWRKDQTRPQYVAAVLLDMIAGRNAQFPVEGHSWQRSRALVVDIWRIAAELKCPAFQNRHGHQVLDDHLALQNAGIPAIDIIDFDYRHWHRLSDVPANCAPDGLEQVARVLDVWLQRIK